jgi:hypothetical protein
MVTVISPGCSNAPAGTGTGSSGGNTNAANHEKAVKFAELAPRLAVSGFAVSPFGAQRRFRTWELHKRLHTHRTQLTRQVGPNENRTICGNFAEPSDGPSTPSLPCAASGNWSQPTATVFACFNGFAPLAIRHWLPPVATTGLHKGSTVCCLY